MFRSFQIPNLAVRAMFVASVAFPCLSFSQFTSAPSDRHSVIGARAASLAEAYVSSAQDIQGMYYNPASILFIRQRSVIVNYAIQSLLERDNQMVENLTTPIALSEGWGMGLGLTYTHVGHVSQRSPMGGLSIKQFGLDLSVAKKLSDPFSVGIGVNVLYGRDGGPGLFGGSGVLGLFYSPSPGISYGASYSTVGKRIQYTAVNGETIVSRDDLHQSVQIGISVLFPNRSGGHVICVTLANQKSIGDAGLIYKGGIEIIPLSFLALRAGYWVGPETVAGKYGAGVFFGRFSIDYAISPSKLEPRYHQASFSFNFGD